MRQECSCCNPDASFHSPGYPGLVGCRRTLRQEPFTVVVAETSAVFVKTERSGAYDMTKQLPRMIRLTYASASRTVLQIWVTSPQEKKWRRIMRNTTLVLTAVVIVCGLLVAQDASASVEPVRGTYELTGPVTTTTGTFDTEIVSMSLTAGGGIYIFGGQNNVDSFFDVFTELSVDPDPPTGTFRVDSFFDVFTELSVAIPPPLPRTNARRGRSGQHRYFRH